MVFKNYGEILSKLKSRGFCATCLSTYDFSTLSTTLPHNLMKEKLLDLIERALKKIFKNEGALYLACNNKKAFFIFLQTIEDINFFDFEVPEWPRLFSSSNGYRVGRGGPSHVIPYKLQKYIVLHVR